MPPSKRRTITEASTGDSQFPPNQKGIRAFGRISKHQNATAEDTQKSIVSESAETSSKSARASSLRPSKKRKLQRHQEESIVQEQLQKTLVDASIDTPPLIDRFTKHPSQTNVDSTTKLRTPTKAARGRFAPLNCNPPSSPITPRQVSSPPLETYDTPPTSPCRPSTPETKLSVQPANLPSEIQDLIDLHTAFLNALSLYYAHHGMSTPANLRLLTVSASQMWGKRKVTVDDVRRLIGLMQMIEEKDKTSQTCKFEMKNLGHEMMVLENSISSKRNRFAFKPFDDEILRDAFQKTLCQLWVSFEEHNGGLGNTPKFLQELPLADIVVSSSVIKPSAKTQRRLEDLKAGAIKVLAKKRAACPHEAKQNAAEVNSRGQSLLERIKAKELQQSKLPPPPSKESVLRRAALQHVEGIAGILSMLKTSQSAKSTSESSQEVQFADKSSFSYGTLVQKIKESMRTPIGAEEVEMCLQLLSNEVASNWIKSVSIGKLRCVVVHHHNQPGLDVLRKRVAEALQQVQ